jgi:hypothetical protein
MIGRIWHGYNTPANAEVLERLGMLISIVKHDRASAVEDRL